VLITLIIGICVFSWLLYIIYWQLQNIGKTLSKIVSALEESNRRKPVE
jgi:hypothetical protein